MHARPPTLRLPAVQVLHSTLLRWCAEHGYSAHWSCGDTKHGGTGVLLRRALGLRVLTAAEVDMAEAVEMMGDGVGGAGAPDVRRTGGCCQGGADRAVLDPVNHGAVTHGGGGAAALVCGVRFSFPGMPGRDAPAGRNCDQVVCVHADREAS